MEIGTLASPRPDFHIWEGGLVHLLWLGWGWEVGDGGTGAGPGRGQGGARAGPGMRAQGGGVSRAWHCALFSPVPHSMTSPRAMVSFMCQPDWTLGPRYLVERDFGGACEVFLDRASTGLSGRSPAAVGPQPREGLTGTNGQPRRAASFSPLPTSERGRWAPPAMDSDVGWTLHHWLSWVWTSRGP